MQQKNSGSKWRLIWPVLWAASIFLSSSSVVTTGQLAHVVTAATSGHVSESGFRHVWGFVWWFFVKGWHAIEFGILFALFRTAIRKSPGLVMILTVLCAFADEGHQLFVPNRGCRLSDVCIDVVGIIASALIRRWLRQRVEKSQSFTASWRFLLAVAVIVILAIFVLAIYPFGLVTLGQTRQVAGP
jgi:hypothetical protein